MELKRLGCNIGNEVPTVEFKNKFETAKSKNRFALCVDSHDLNDLRGMKCLMTESGDGFVAVESDGNINSVLRDITLPRSNNFMRDLIATAVTNGGRKLDCYAIHGRGLPVHYTRCGFVPVVKCKWNDEFAPDGWNYERDGRPDIIFMYYCGDDANIMVLKNNSGKYKEYSDYDISYITELPQYTNPPEDYDWDSDEQDLSDYSQCMRYRDWIMEKALKFKN